MARRKSTGKRKRRKRSPARIWLAGLYILALWLAIAWGRAALLPRLVQVKLADETLFESSRPCRALVVRTETVIEAPYSGQFIPVVSDGELVRAKTVIGRITNELEEQRLALELDAVARELAQAEAELHTFSAQADDAVAALRRDFDEQMRSWAIASSGRRFGELGPLIETIEAIARDIDDLCLRLESQRECVVTLERKHAGLVLAQEQVVFPVTVEVAGHVSLWLDGLEATVSREWLQSQHPESLLRLEPKSERVPTGAEVSAGRTLARLVDPFEFTLALPLPQEVAAGMTVGKPVPIRIGDREIVALSLGTVGPIRSGQQLLALSVDRALPEFVRDRFVDVVLIEHRCYGVVVPLSSIVERQGQQGVFTVVKATVGFVPITVSAEDGARALVDGLRPGTRIVTNPRLVWDGMSLP